FLCQAVDGLRGATVTGVQTCALPISCRPRAGRKSLDAMAATFAQLAVGTTEVQVAQTLSREMEQRGAPGGGLVQFGPSSALPHEIGRASCRDRVGAAQRAGSLRSS